MRCWAWLDAKSARVVLHRGSVAASWWRFHDCCGARPARGPPFHDFLVPGVVLGVVVGGTLLVAAVARETTDIGLVSWLQPAVVHDWMVHLGSTAEERPRALPGGRSLRSRGR